MRQVNVDLWVVYQRPIKGCVDGVRAVCEKREWEAMDRAKPGFYTLIQADIVHEGEAERLARGTSGATPIRATERILLSLPN